MVDDPTDNDSILEDLDAVVDVVLGEGLEPPEPESAWERRQRILDSWTAIILAVAAVATAWASFQASQWSTAESDAQSASAIARADAGRAATSATQATIIDSQTWLDWVSAVAAGQKGKADFLDSLLLALVLFFASVATKFGNRSSRSCSQLLPSDCWPSGSSECCSCRTPSELGPRRVRQLPSRELPAGPACVSESESRRSTQWCWSGGQGS